MIKSLISAVALCAVATTAAAGPLLQDSKAEPVAAGPVVLSASELDRVNAGHIFLIAIRTSPFHLAIVRVGNPLFPAHFGAVCVNAICHIVH